MPVTTIAAELRIEPEAPATLPPTVASAPRDARHDEPPYWLDASGMHGFPQLVPAPGWTPPPRPSLVAQEPLAAFRRAARRCYERALKSPPHTGRLTLTVSLRGGRVVSATASGDAGTEELGRCLERAAWRLTLATDEPVEITVPFAFEGNFGHLFRGARRAGAER